VTTSPAGEHELVVTASPEGEEELVVAATPTDPQLAETRPDELFGPAGSDLSDETGGRRGGDGA
jgi:hypothetical protein